MLDPRRRPFQGFSPTPRKRTIPAFLNGGCMILLGLILVWAVVVAIVWGLLMEREKGKSNRILKETKMEINELKSDVDEEKVKRFK